MRSFRLVRIAAEAELLRLRFLLQRVVSRAILGVIAAVFLLGTLVFAHLALWFWISGRVAEPYAALIMAGGDFLVGLILALLATRSSPSRAERDALEVRRRALDNVGGALAWTTLAVQALRALSRLRSRGGA